jgi:signal transduction histidine kinase
MRSLFLRIFLWFGLAMVLVNVASFAMGVLVERRFQPPRTPPFGPMMALIGQTSVELYERDGPTALRNYLERVHNVARVRAVLLNSNGNELSGLPQPANSTSIAANVSSSKPLHFEFINGPENNSRSPLAAQWISSPTGQSYTLVATLPPPEFPRPPRIGEAGSLLFGLRVSARTLLPLLLVGGLFCYLLARSLAKPIEQLRSTTHELSAGNLTARVDTTLLKRRDEIGELSKDFNLMAGHIESLVDAQRQLITDISHELRSPLARQTVALGLARRRGNEEVMSSLDRIAREAMRMNEMIGQLLDLSRVESGADSVTPTRIDLATLIEEIVQDADYEARDNGKSVKVVTSETASMNGAVELLSSAFENVIRNAVRYTAPDTMVEVSLKNESQNGNKNFVVTVRDHGQGVPEESLTSIFRAFYRVDAARDRKSGGSGLGLAIAARAVKLHGGQITARNATDGGLIVEICIPQT